MPSVSDPPSVRLPAIIAVLEQTYGRPAWTASGRPLDTLVSTILSQNTSDVNSDRAFRSLRQHFATYRDVRDAPTPAVADAIRSGGLADIKAKRIQEVLHRLPAPDGEPALPDLAAMPITDAQRYLRHLPGVGPKTAACVLMFGLGLPALPVDTHVHRVSRRLGLIPDRLSADAAHEVLEQMTPPADIFSLHVNLVRHGRRVCQARRPRCEICPLASLCPYPHSHGGSARPAPRGTRERQDSSRLVSESP